jgi:hypothetical protein
MFLGSILALQGWTLLEVVNLKTKAAQLEQQMNDRIK